MNTELRSNRRGARMRACTLLALVAVTALVAACGREQPSEPSPSVKEETAAEHALRHADPLYRCPMHPDVVRSAPGQCPICGMDLVKVEPEPPAAAGPEVRISSAVINNLGVRTEPATLAALPRRAATTGYVSFDDRRVRQVRPRAEGWIEGLSVRAPGETVVAGQLLFTVYSPMLESAQQEYLDALRIGNADLVAASRDRLRALGLDSGTAARLARGDRASGRVPFHAPVAGVITELAIREGAMVTPDMTAMAITELGSLWVIAEVPESQAAWVASGTSAELRFASLPGETLAGVVEHVYPELSLETRTVRARIVLERPHSAIRANMLANVTLLGEPGAAAVTIPRNALIRSGTEDRVVVALGEGRFVPRRVTAGAESGERIAIVDGLAAGEQVVVAGQFLLDSEANLRSGLGRLGHEDHGAAPPAEPGDVAPAAAGDGPDHDEHDAH
jgi:membrane fusion protein, copper/silver efflux system